MSVNTGANPQGGQATSPTTGLSWNPQAQPTITAGAYTTGKVVGGAMVFQNAFIGNSGMLTGFSITDTAAQTLPMYLFLLRSQPTGSYANGTAFTMAAADAVNCIWSYNIQSTNWVTSGSFTIASVDGLAKSISSDTLKTIWLLAVSNGSATYTATNNLVFTLDIEQN